MDPRWRLLGDTVQAVFNLGWALFPALGEAPLRELCDFLELDDALVRKDGTAERVLGQAVIVGLDLTVAEWVLRERIVQGLGNARLRQGYAALRSAVFGAWHFEPVGGGGVRFEPWRDPLRRPGLTVHAVTEEVHSGRPGCAVGWLIPEFDGFVGEQLESAGVRSFGNATISNVDQWELEALRAAADPHGRLQADPEQRLFRELSTPESVKQLRAYASRWLLDVSRPVEVERGLAITLHHLVMGSSDEALGARLSAHVEHIYGLLAAGIWWVDGADAEISRVLFQVIPPDELLGQWGLNREEGIVGWQPDVLLRHPAALLRLPAGHPAFDGHGQDVPMGVLRGGSGEGGEAIDAAIELYLLEQRFVRTARLLPLNPESRFNEVLEFVVSVAHPDIRRSPLTDLGLGRGAARRVARALEWLNEAERRWTLADLHQAASLLAAPGFGPGSLTRLSDALIEWLGVWRAHALGIAPAALAAAPAEADPEMREGLDEIGRLFE